MRNTVMSFLAIPEQLMAVPQIVVIDRKGQVRAQTSPRDEDEIRKADVMRKLLDTLLKESAGTTVSSVTKKTGK
jgi:type IV secretory pathway TrbF-like protein